jgi:membrane protease YdiL (CAAX protease family)
MNAWQNWIRTVVLGQRSVAESFSQAASQGTLAKVIQFPLTRMVVAFLFIAPVFLLSNLFHSRVIKNSPADIALLLMGLRFVLMLAGLYFMFRLYTRVVEKRQAHELSLSSSGFEFGLGVLLSLVMIGSVVGLLALLGYYKVDQLNPAIVLVSGGLHFILIALVEELVFRVIFFKLLEELFGSWIALVSTCILFGLLHLVNPNATWFSAFSVAVHSLAWVAAFMLTRRIWLAAGIHFAWNFAQSCIFGIPCSGILSYNWITANIQGPDWITGGGFGLEASFVLIGLSMLLGLYLLRNVARQGRTVGPRWRRSAIAP